MIARSRPHGAQETGRTTSSGNATRAGWTRSNLYPDDGDLAVLAASPPAGCSCPAHPRSQNTRNKSPGGLLRVYNAPSFMLLWCAISVIRKLLFRLGESRPHKLPPLSEMCLDGRSWSTLLVPKVDRKDCFTAYPSLGDINHRWRA